MGSNPILSERSEERATQLLVSRGGFEDRSDVRVVRRKSDRRAPRGAACEKFPSGYLLVGESHPLRTE